MSESNRFISFPFGRRLPLILQSEQSECGLACLGMIAGYYGYQATISELRRDAPVSSRGLSLGGLIRTAMGLRLSARAVRVELHDVVHLRLPCILHWNVSHFIVLKSASRRHVVIHDPAYGTRKMRWKEFSAAFTGYAVELWPGSDFQTKKSEEIVPLRSILGRLHGYFGVASQVIALAVLIECLGLANPLFMQWTLDHVIPLHDDSLLVTLAIGFLLLALTTEALRLIRAFVVAHVGAILNLQLRVNAFNHLLGAPMEYYAKRGAGEIISRFSSIDVIQRTITGSVLEVYLDGLVAVITLAMMVAYSPKLAFISFGALLIYFTIRSFSYINIRSLTEELIVHTGKQTSHLIESIHGARSIKLFQRQAERSSIWQRHLANQVNADYRVQQTQVLCRSGCALVFASEKIVVVYFAAMSILDGAMSAGLLVAYIAYKTQFIEKLTSLIDKAFEIRMLSLQTARLADIFHTPREDAGTSDLILPSTWGIELRNVSFQYGSQDRSVLSDVNLKISAGECIAIVGPSGCGKSTLLNIICGLLRPTKGDIYIGGLVVNASNLQSLRRAIGVVMQDDNLLAGTISENISFFDMNPDTELVKKCAAIAAIDEDIRAMPMGYESHIGELGTTISGGQKQRILLARALYKRPQVLIMDEATSHLDVETENQVNTNISSLRMTRIIVAHRPETIRSADRIIDLSTISWS